jgi:death on curing protein
VYMQHITSYTCYIFSYVIHVMCYPMPVVEIALFLQVAERILDIDADRLKNVTKIGSAESAIAAPFASFGGHDFYEHPVQRAAILASRIMRNHPLPDGNKRVALILMEHHLEDQGLRCTASDIEIDRVFRAVAASEMNEDYFHVWLLSRTAPIDKSP